MEDLTSVIKESFIQYSGAFYSRAHWSMREIV